MRVNCVEVFDIDFKDFQGVGEIIEAVCKLDKIQREVVYPSIANHIRIMLEEERIITVAFGEVESGKKAVRIWVFDAMPDGNNYDVKTDEDGNKYIEMEE